MAGRSCRVLLAAPLFLMAALTGCPFITTPEKPIGDSDPFEARTSPESVLANLKMAYQDRAIAEYESLLARDFTFYFTTEDASRPEIDESWGRAEEIESHEGMFDSEYVQTLTLDFSSNAAVYDPQESTEQDSLWRVEATNVDLELFGTPRSHPGEPPQLFEVENGHATFWFRRNPWLHDNGKPVWNIVQVQEKSITPP